ncbi:MAG: sigma-70 family RNA polymerase sigma factor [Acidobacteria bacterium]|nr:sigma-70 family RNA polymerase sigma factor [Acidobacteriota bacterium]
MTTLFSDQMTDADLVVAVQGGNRDAFATLYRRYFDRIYDFVARTLRNDADAAEVVQDVFVLVDTKVGQLREPAAFRGWIFAIARRQSLNRIRDRKNVQPMAPIATDERPLNPLLTAVDVSRIDDPEHASAVKELAQLVWEAAEALPEKQYMLLDLSVRQGLDSGEIAKVLGVTRGNAYTMFSRMRARLGDQIGTYLLVRKGSRHCRGLELVVASADLPPVDEQLRKNVERHVAECDECTERKKRMLAPHQVLAALAAVPAPTGLADSVWGALPGNGGGGSSGRWRKYLAALGVVIAVFGVTAVAADRLPGDQLVSTTVNQNTPVALGDTTTTTTTKTTSAPPTTAPNQPPFDLVIVAPTDLARLTVNGSDQQGVFWSGRASGSADYDGSGVLTYEWFSDQTSVRLGVGKDAVILLRGAAGAPVTHVLTMRVKDDAGMFSEVSITVDVVR